MMRKRAFYLLFSLYNPCCTYTDLQHPSLYKSQINTNASAMLHGIFFPLPAMPKCTLQKTRPLVGRSHHQALSIRLSIFMPPLHEMLMLPTTCPASLLSFLLQRPSVVSFLISHRGSYGNLRDFRYLVLRLIWNIGLRIESVT